MSYDIFLNLCLILAHPFPSHISTAGTHATPRHLNSFSYAILSFYPILSTSSRLLFQRLSSFFASFFNRFRQTLYTIISGTPNSTTSGTNRVQDINKDTNISLVHWLTSAECKERFKLDQIVRGSLKQWLFDDSTEVSQKLWLARCKKAENCLNKKSVGKEHFEVGSVSNE